MQNSIPVLLFNHKNLKTKQQENPERKKTNFNGKTLHEAQHIYEKFHPSIIIKPQKIKNQTTRES